MAATDGRLEYGTQVTTADDSPGPDRVDPAYEGLFRPEDIVPPSPPADARSEPVADEPLGEDPQRAVPVEDEAEDEAVAEAPDEAAAPPARQPVAETGRLFRSQGVAGHDETVLALESGRFSRLRTLDRTDSSAAPIPSTPAVDAADSDVAALLAPATEPDPAAGGPMPERESRRRGRRETGNANYSSRGARAGVVYLVVIGLTVVVGIINALLGDGTLGWPTGLALLIGSVYGALTIRRDADSAAFIIPPVAFLVAALTAGQLFLDANEGSLLNRAVIVFFTLAENWIWIIGSTLVALVIVLVRRRRT
jgi:hypothetical protein